MGEGNTVAPVTEAGERGRPRDPRNDKTILDAAVDLFIERGADGAGIEAVARRAGVAKLTVYRRWPGRDELLIAAIEHVRGPSPEPFGAGASVGDAVSAMARQLSRTRFRDLSARVIGASVDHRQLIEVYSARHLQPRLDALHGLIQRAIEAGEFPAGTDAEIVRDALWGSICLTLFEPNPGTSRQIESRLHRLLDQFGHRPPL